MGRYGGAFGRRAGEPLDRGAPGGRARRARGRVRPLRPAARLQGRLGRGGRLPRGEAHGTRVRFLRGAPAARRARRRGRRRLDRGRPVRAGRLLRRRRRRAVVPRGRHHAPLRRAQIAGKRGSAPLAGPEGSWQGVPGPAVGRADDEPIESARTASRRPTSGSWRSTAGSTTSPMSLRCGATPTRRCCRRGRIPSTGSGSRPPCSIGAPSARCRSGARRPTPPRRSPCPSTRSAASTWATWSPYPGSRPRPSAPASPAACTTTRPCRPW